MLWKVVLLMFTVYMGVNAQDCESLRNRYNYLLKDYIYQDLMSEADKLITEGCSKDDNKTKRVADRILSSLEVIKEESLKEYADKKLLAVITQKRLRNALATLNGTRKYKDKYQTLYFYQLLFYQVARENSRAKDYNYALKYAQASYLLGRAILELR